MTALLLLQLLTFSPDCAPICPVEPGEESLQLNEGQRVLSIDADWSGTASSGAIRVLLINPTTLLIIGTRSGRGDLKIFTPRGVRHVVVRVTNRDPDDCGIGGGYKRMPCGGDFDFRYTDLGVKLVGTYRNYEELLQVLAYAREYPAVPIPPVPPKMFERAFGEVNASLFLAGSEARVRCRGSSLELYVERPQSAEAMARASALVSQSRQLLVQLCALEPPV